MNAAYARTIGRVQAMKAVSSGLGLAYLIMAGLSGSLSWLGHAHYWPNLVVAAVWMYLCGYCYGGRAGTAILLQKRAAAWIGTGYGLLTLLTVTFLASWVGFFQEGIPKVGTADDPFVDYIAKPLFLVTLVGFLPTLLVGLWFGNSIKQVGSRHAKTITSKV
jgi:hypothetical protein